MPPPPGIVIEPAKVGDLAQLSKIQVAAYTSDLISHMMTLNRPEEWSYEDLLRSGLEFSFSDPSVIITKAVDQETGHIVAWSCWALKEAVKKNVEPETEETKEDSMGKEVHSANAENESKASAQPAKLGRQVLGQTIGMEAMKWSEEWIGHRKHMVLQGLFTQPQKQGSGIGSALIEFGLERVDDEALPCWVHASPASWKLYAKQGFEEVGKTELNLSEWAPGGKDRDNGWGTYTFRYMLREAR